MNVFVAEGLESTAVLQVLEQPFEALPVTALFFVRSLAPLTDSLEKIMCF